MLKNNFMNLFTQWFDKPKVSIFDLSKRVSTSAQIGKWYPTYWTICGFGDSEKGNSTHKMRLAPLMAPNFADLRVNEHAIVVPLRVIMRDYEAKFNYAKNRDGAHLPTIETAELLKVYKAMGSLGLSPVGSLFDFVGLPVFADFYKALVSQITNAKFGLGASFDQLQDNSFYNTLTQFKFSYRGVVYTINSAAGSNTDTELFGISIYDLATYFAEYHLSDEVRDNFVHRIQVLMDNYDSLHPTWDTVVHVANTEYGFNLTVTELFNMYYNYIFISTVSQFFEAIHDSDSPFMEREYTILPLMAYHRCVADWSLVPNVTDPDVYLQTYVYDFKSNLLSLADAILSGGALDDDKKTFESMVMPKDRLWDVDFFTSMLPTATAGDEIEIPANSTVIDMARLTAMQKLVMKLSYSTRYRDVVWNIFNIRPSDARLQQSSVIQSNQHFVQIGETIQTSETTVSSVLGAFGGRGYSAGTKKGYHIFCEEPCVVMNFYSLVAKPTYMDALHPLCHLDDIFDFPIPDMDVLGNQPVPTDLLTGNPEDGTPFGFSRQYIEWLANYGTVHNEMKTTLDYWTLSRRFDTRPGLNEDFLTINPNDDFDRIFSVQDSTHAFLDIYYNVKVTRPVRRSVRILV